MSIEEKKKKKTYVRLEAVRYHLFSKIKNRLQRQPPNPMYWPHNTYTYSSSYSRTVKNFLKNE